MNTKVWISVSGFLLLLALVIGAPGSTAAVAAPAPAGQTLTYGAAPVAFTGAEAALPITIRGTSHTPISEGFETAWPHSPWKVEDQSANPTGDYLWAQSSCHPHSGAYAIRSHSGGNQGKLLNCDAPYPNNLRTATAASSIDLSKAASVRLEFYFYGKSEEPSTGCLDGDFLWFGVSPDGVSFLQGAVCGDMTGGPAGNGYYHFDADVSSMIAGQPNAVVAFAMVSNGSVTNMGFMVDDVSVRITSTDPQLWLPMLRK